MMPIMTAALATLTAQNVARGSTLLNITQQVAASIGTALFSVILTNEIKGSDAVGLPVRSRRCDGEPTALAAVLAEAGRSPAEHPGPVRPGPPATWPTRSPRCSSSPRSWSPAA